MSKTKIDKFEGEYAFLSNFYPCQIHYAFHWFQCSEALYMAHKSGKEEDFARFAPLDAREAKKLGRKVELQPGWDDMRIDVMRRVVWHKFAQNPPLEKRLMATGEAELIEGNWWKDCFWGVCNGVGENNLGKLLMELRDELHETYCGSEWDYRL